VIIHRSCIEKWYNMNRLKEESKDATAWRCPGCLFIMVEPPPAYRCYCKKSN